MHFQRSARHLLLAPALISAIGLAVTACSSGSNNGSSSSPSSSPSGSPTTQSTPAPTGVSASATPSTPSSAVAQIEKNWASFFLANTPVAQRVALLQNGSQFESVIKAQANSALASSVTAKVGAVTVESATKAKVVYSIFLAGSPALANQKGVAIKENGTWKVGDASFCGLLAVQNSGNTSKLPAACHSAG